MSKIGFITVVGIWGMWGSLILPAQTPSPVQDIFFLTKDSDLLSTPPATVMLEITVSDDIFYKLFFKGKIIKAGLMNRGQNIVHINSDLVLDEETPHPFILEWKTGSLVGRQEIFIDVELHRMRKVVEKKPETRKIQAGISLYIDGRLLAASEKTYIQEIVPEVKIPPQEPPKYGYYVPFSTEDNPMDSAFSILDAVGLLYSLGKSIVEKKEAKEKSPPLLRRKQIVLVYVRPDGEGRFGRVQAVLSIRALK